MSAHLWNRMGREAEQTRVRLFAPQSLRTEDRISISSGTADVEILDINGQDYVSGARLPTSPWRSLSEEEHAAVWTETPGEIGRVVAIAHILDQESLEAIRQSVPALRLLRLTDQQLSKHPHIQLLLDKSRAAVNIGEPVDCNGLAEHPPGLATVTFDRGQGAYIGLHVDSWDQLPVEQRATARNRICINLGLEDRFFLFLNLTVDDMLSQLQALSEMENLSSAKLIGKAFMRSFPDYPIMKVRIRPGEAYVAPTENIVHDATSVDSQTTSCHITFRGFFALRQSDSAALRTS